MNELSATVLSLLLDWSIRWGILIGALALLLWLRPPGNIAHRLILGRLVLLAGLILPLTPVWWSIPLPNVLMPDALKSQPPLSEQMAPDSLSSEVLLGSNFPDKIRAKSQPPLPEEDSGLGEVGPTSTREAIPTPPTPNVPLSAPGISWKPDWRFALAAIWIAGAIFGLFRLGLGLWWLGQIKRKAQAPTDQLLTLWAETRDELGVSRNAQLKLSDQVKTPALLGGFFPVVVIPPEWEQANSRDLRVAFLHEWTHIHHRDDWAKCIEEMTRAFFFFHPLVHWLLNRLGIDREQRCDAVAIRNGISPRTLAEVLLEQVKHMGAGNAILAPSPAIQFYHPCSAKERIQNLLEMDMKRWSEPLSRIQRIGTTMLIICLTLGLGGLGSAVATIAPTAPPTIPQAGDAVEISGNVLLADGKTATDALVWAAKLELSPMVRLETKTDSKGNFRMLVPEGSWLIWARQGTQGAEPPSPAGLGGQWELSAKNKPGPISIRLEERGTIRGQMTLAESGKPLSKAQIYLDNGTIVTTDSEGKWELGGLKRTHHEAFVVAPGRMRQRILFDTTGSAQTQLDLAIPPGSKIVGTVTDTKGDPIPGAWVGRSTSGSYFSIHGLFEVCNKDGTFEYFDAVEPGQPTRLTAHAPGYESSVKDPILVEPGVTTRIQFQLAKSPPKGSAEKIPGEKARRIVSGKILTPDSKPAEGILLQWGGQQFLENFSTRSDKEGKFSLVAPDEDNLLTILPKNYPPLFHPVQGGGNREIQVPLQPGTQVTGIVLDAKNRPIEGVAVIPVMTSGSNNPDEEPNECFLTWNQENIALTDKDGKFTIQGIREGLTNNAHFDFLKIGYTDLRSQKLVTGGEINKVKLLSGGAIKGKVVDSEGKPIRNFRVTVNPPKDWNNKDKMDGYFAGYSGMGVRFTSQDGRFVLTGLGLNNTLRIQAYADGYGEAVENRAVTVSIHDLENAPETVIRAKPVSPLNILVTHKGQPVSGAKITLVDGSTHLDQSFSWGLNNASWEYMVRGRTDETGKAHFSNLSIGEATILVEAPGFARQRFPWRKGEKKFDVALVSESILVGQFPMKTEKGGNLYGRLWSTSGDVISFAITDKQQGQFQVRELPAGKWELTIDSTPKSIRQNIELKAGTTLKWKPPVNLPKEKDLPGEVNRVPGPGIPVGAAPVTAIPVPGIPDPLDDVLPSTPKDK